MQPPPVPVNLPGWFQDLVASLPAWAQQLVFALLPFGGWGLFVIAFLDSSFLTFPIINDALVIALSLLNPERMLFYATMATAGSILGCLVIYFLFKKGGEVALRRKVQPEQIKRLARWYEKYEFLTITVPAVMPPPTPFKIFIMAAGTFQVRLRHFLPALVLGRGVRYYLVGFLAVQFGEPAITFVRQNFLQVSLIAVLLVAVGFLVIRMASRRRTGPFQTPAS